MTATRLVAFLPLGRGSATGALGLYCLSVPPLCPVGGTSRPNCNSGHQHLRGSSQCPSAHHNETRPLLQQPCSRPHAPHGPARGQNLPCSRTTGPHPHRLHRACSRCFLGHGARTRAARCCRSTAPAALPASLRAAGLAGRALAACKAALSKLTGSVAALSHTLPLHRRRQQQAAPHQPSLDLEVTGEEAMWLTNDGAPDWVLPTSTETAAAAAPATEAVPVAAADALPTPPAASITSTPVGSGSVLRQGRWLAAAQRRLVGGMTCPLPPHQGLRLTPGRNAPSNRADLPSPSSYLPPPPPPACP